MAVRLDYVLKETGSNLVRNLTLTLASLLTVAIALAFVAVSYLIGTGINQSFLGLRSDVQMFVYMNPSATEEQVESVRNELEGNPQVGEVDFLNKEATYAEFQRLFEDQPDFVQAIKPEELPQSFRVKPTSTDADVVSAVGAEFETMTGVLRVVYAEEYARQVQRSLTTLNSWVRIFGIALIFVSVLLIFNTIRTAVFARRREIEVMRLVGASNWFIRLPFMTEGMVQGMLGAFAAAGLTWGFDALWKRNFVNQVSFELLNQIKWTSGDLWTAVLMILAVGAITGAIGSGIAVGRYLKV
ncbi:MAG TPA: permease-like cell division protein FtsX [Microthrixaceae bacterium]|nr:permease-like cell division protein FtsX [Microthrixaceae bacterium]